MAWTKNRMHFGCTTTQRVEGGHSILKRLLGSSTGSLVLVWNAIHLMITNQLLEIEKDMQWSIFKLHTSNDPLVRDIRGVVSTTAIDKIIAEKERGNGFLKLDASTCGCLLRSTHGLPCAHELRSLKEKGNAIPIHYVDRHWRQLSKTPIDELDVNISKDEEVKVIDDLWGQAGTSGKVLLKQKLKEIASPMTTLVGEPLVVSIKKGRPSKSKSKRNSTKREKSAFEYVETQDVLESKSEKKNTKGSAKKNPKNKEDIIYQKYITKIPEAAHPLIAKITDVPGNFNSHVFSIV